MCLLKPRKVHLTDSISVASSKIEISRGKFVVFLANAVWGPVALRRPEFGGLNWAVPEKKAYTEGL